MGKYLIKGGNKLEGTVNVSGSKNAALPIICATLLTDKVCTLTGVPDIADIRSLISILEFLGCKVKFEKNTLTINPKNLKNKYVPGDMVCKLRASILLLGPLLTRFSKVKMSFPGGCILGKRPVESHLRGFEGLGAKVIDYKKDLHLKVDKLVGNDIVLTEISVTATENVIMAAVLAKGITKLRLAAAEPHVQDLCHFLNKLGAKIRGIGSHELTITGVTKLKGSEHKITGDYLEAGTFAIAAALTKGDVTIKNTNPDHLDSFWQKLEEAGVPIEYGKSHVRIKPYKKLNQVEKIRTAVYPSFPTDLQAPFAVLLTQCPGVSKIFETLFEGRLNYLFELEKMGANFEILNPHQAIIIGKTALKGVPISSWDIRAGAAMVLAALTARGSTEINNIGYIDRGYERLEQKLRKLGANIKRIQD